MEEEQNIPNCQNGDQSKYITSYNLENIESISPPDQHKRDRDTMVPKGWKLGKDASSDVAYVIQVFGHCMQ